MRLGLVYEGRCGDSWVFEPLPHALQRQNGLWRINFDSVSEENICRNLVNRMWSKYVRRKVSEIVGHDHRG